MLSLPKLFALGTLSLATLASAAPTSHTSDVVVRTDDGKGHKDHYCLDNEVDFKEVKVEVIIIEVDCKDYVCVPLYDFKEKKKEHEDPKKEYKRGDPPKTVDPPKDDYECKNNELILTIKECEFLCIEIDLKDWSGFDWGYMKKPDGEPKWEEKPKWVEEHHEDPKEWKDPKEEPCEEEGDKDKKWK